MDVTETNVWVGKEYELATPTKNGYAFAGWYFGNESVGISGEWKYEEDVVLKAKWEIRDENGIVYERVEGGYIITGYRGEAKRIIIVPQSYNGINIVGIKANAFKYLDERVEQTKYKHIKIYVPADAISDSDASQLGEIIMVSRYSKIEPSGIIYLESDTDVSLVGYIGSYNEHINIPNSYNDKPVTSIGDYAFYGSSYFIPEQENDYYRVRIPKSIKSIGKNAFGLCNDVRVILYEYKGESISEIVDKSKQYDWLKDVTIKENNDHFVEVLSQMRPAFGWELYTKAGYYIRLNPMGGTVTKVVEGMDINNKPIFVLVVLKDVTFYQNEAYTLPIPERHGFEFEGWYYNNKLIPQSGSTWKFGTHIELTAKWSEIK